MKRSNFARTAATFATIVGASVSVGMSPERSLVLASLVMLVDSRVLYYLRESLFRKWRDK
jgi:hypothetical protein